jgi:hypothetical protein
VINIYKKPKNQQIDKLSLNRKYELSETKMKYSFFILVAIFGLTFAAETKFSWENVPEVVNTSQCVYRSEERLFSCRGPSGIVDCGAVTEFGALGERRFDVFGLGRWSSEIERVEDIRYWLYPRSVDNTTYMNHTIVINGEPIDLFVYYGEKFLFTGIRVTELKCYERLVELFRLSVAEHTPIIGGIEREESRLFGEVLFMDKQLKKRWWGGWGWGAGWGYGWGWPYGLGWWGRK